MIFTFTINTLLAYSYIRKTKYKRRKRGYNPTVTAIIPAYNEGKVIIKTVESILKSRYKELDIIIVDDGSKDDTWPIAKELSRMHPKVKALRLIRNRGKATALNKGIKSTKSDIVVCLDADTLFKRDTINKFVRHFSDPKVGAVSGVVKVGNVGNLITRWQALEYIVSIHIERNAQARLGSVLVVPGACGAWRREAIIKAGGYTRSTLAEDCDLTLSVHEAGYSVVQDNKAISFTEAPMTLDSLAKQRFRWIFGNIQSFWKHRHMAFRHQNKWLANFILPLAMVNILMYLLFWPLLLTVTVQNWLAGRFVVILIFLVLTTSLQFIFAYVGLVLAKENFSHILAVPFTRLMYGPLRTYLLYRALLTALKGANVGWNKFKRTGTVKMPTAVNVQSSK